MNKDIWINFRESQDFKDGLRRLAKVESERLGYTVTSADILRRGYYLIKRKIENENQRNK